MLRFFVRDGLFCETFILDSNNTAYQRWYYHQCLLHAVIAGIRWRKYFRRMLE